MEEKGSISIHSENIFPIIKKFLYSDTEIFLRELVSNAVDASQKLKHLSSIGEYNGEMGDIKVKVAFDKEAKTITISDRGIGLTAEEIKKYINQIAFSGATEFVEKYKKDEDAQSQIIGHFGLGFYSAYMVAHTVEIQSLSHKEGAEAAKWVCDGSTNYEISAGSRTERGTDIILHISEDGEEFLEEARLKGILDKYCKFLPIEIEFNEAVINNPSPLWTKNPTELKDEDYLAFYKELYPFSEDPLFWIHLNVDYPFNLTGILYFPKIKPDVEVQKNKIHLYSRQVFITDEVKDVVPDFLMLLHGVIDSPDIPLNVSRSFLQADGNVRKINSHITKKVGDKLKELFTKDRAAFEQKWEFISMFVKYGMLSEDKFYDKAEKFCLLENVDGGKFTIDEYKTKIEALQKDKDDNLIALYSNNINTQDAYISSAKAKGYDVLKFDSVLDSHFVGNLEQKNEKFQMKRIDAESVNKLIDKGEETPLTLSETETESIKGIFEKVISQEGFTVAIEGLDSDELPVAITQAEFMRRMKEMSQIQGGGMAMMGSMPDSYSVVVNGNHPVIQKIINADSDEIKADLAKQSFDLALLSQGMLKGADLTSFIKRSINIVAN